MPIDLYEAQSFSAIGFTVAIKGEGTALVARLGVRADDGTGTKPGALIKDYGTVSVESTGEKTISVTQSYGPGRIWIGIVIQGTALTVGPTLNGIATYGGTTRGVDTLGNTSQRALKVSGITGVFGAEPGTIERVALAPLLGLKAA
jgi:hypothetical protein